MQLCSPKATQPCLLQHTHSQPLTSSTRHAASRTATKPTPQVVAHTSINAFEKISSKPAIAATSRGGVRRKKDEPQQEESQQQVLPPGSTGKVPGRSAQRAFARAAGALTRFGWLGFMLQLILTSASAVLLIFEVAFTPRNGPAAALYLVLAGIGAGLASIISNFKYVRMGARMRGALLGRQTRKPIRKNAVLDMVVKGVVTNCFGLGTALVAMQALLAQLLMQPTIMPDPGQALLSGHATPERLWSIIGTLTSQQLDPFLTLDVFLFQSASNMLLSHFLSLVCSLWLLSAVGRGHTARVQKMLTVRKNKRQEDADDKVVISKGNAARYVIDSAQIGTGGADGMAGKPAGSTSRSTLFSGSDISSALASALRSARQRNHPWSESASSMDSLDDPIAAWFMSSDSLDTTMNRNGNLGRPSSVPSSIEGGSWDIPASKQNPASIWDPAPPEPLHGKSPQWGSKIRVSTGGGKEGSDGQEGESAGGRKVTSIPKGGAANRGKKGRQPSSRSAARTALGITLPARQDTLLESKIAQRVPTSLPVIPMADARSLSYLDGHLPGDMGFDPLHLFDPENGGAGVLSQNWLRYAEVVHGRWAMLGVIGCLTPEALAMRGTIPEERGVEWFRTGFLPTVGQDVDYGWDPVSIAWVQFIILGIAETRRLQDYLKPGCLAAEAIKASDGSEPELSRELVMALSTPPGDDPVYPGGPVFNFFDFVESASATRRYKEKEIKHGRLAMVAMLGFIVQAAFTHVGPYTNLVEHLMDPCGNNIITKLFGMEQ